MNLLINDNDFKKAVREEVEKVVGRDAKALVEQTIQNKLNAFAEIKDDDLFKTIKERIHTNSSWDSSRLQENITKTLEKNIKPLFEDVGKSIVENYTKEYLNAYLYQSVRNYINDSTELQKFIADQIKEAIARIMVEKFMMKG